MKLNLPVDLVTINCNNIEDGKKALEYSSKFIDFNNIYYFTDAEIEGNFEIIKINKIDHIRDYNNFILNLRDYIKSPYVLVIQDDGHVLNQIFGEMISEYIILVHLGLELKSGKRDGIDMAKSTLRR